MTDGPAGLMDQGERRLCRISCTFICGPDAICRPALPPQSSRKRLGAAWLHLRRQSILRALFYAIVSNRQKTTAKFVLPAGEAE